MSDEDWRLDRAAIRLGLHGRKLRRLIDYLGERAEILEIVNDRGWWLLEETESGGLVLVTKEEFHEMYILGSPSMPSGMHYAINISEYSRRSKFLIRVLVSFYYALSWVRTLIPRIKWSLEK